MKIINKILILSVIVLMISCGVDNSKKYVLSPEQTLKTYINKTDILPVEKVANIFYCPEKMKTYRFIDLRTPHDFIVNHVDSAINVPAKDIFNNENFDILNQDKKINVIYGYNATQAIDVYLMLKQLNYKNIKVALGGFDFINKYMINDFGIKTGIYNDEKPKYDYAKVVAETAGGTVPTDNNTSSKPKKKLIKRKKKEVTGGCG